MEKLRTLSPEQQKSVFKYLSVIHEGRSDPIVFATKVLGMQVHEGQMTWLTETCMVPNRKKNILVPGNRFGKTLITAIKHLWKCFYKIGIQSGESRVVISAAYRTLNLASHSEQAKACAEYIKKIIKGEFTYYDGEKWVTNTCTIPDFLPEQGISDSPYANYRFANGSVFSSRTIGDDRGGSVQGMAYAFISYDECARSHRLEDEIEPDILPRLIDLDGDLDLLSTPDKDSPSLQYYYELCELGKERIDGWYTQEGSREENTFISKRAHERADENITDTEVRTQVKEGKFVFSGGRMFSGEKIRKIWNPDILWEPLPLTLLIANVLNGKKKEDGKQYIIGVDFARSESGDATVAKVLDCTQSPYEIVSVYRVTGVPIQTQMQDIRTIKAYYGGRLVIDGNGLGGKIIGDLLSSERPESFDFKGKQKEEMLFLLKKAIDEERLRAPKPTVANNLQHLRRELGAYKEEDAKLKTDSVMALGMAIWLADAVPPARISPIKLFQRTIQ